MTGFTTPAGLNGFYAPYYNASQAPAALQPCTNAGPYGSTKTNWLGSWNATWQAAGHPVGYYNTAGAVNSSSNYFWVRDFYDPFLAETQSFWNLVNGALLSPRC